MPFGKVSAGIKDGGEVELLLLVSNSIPDPVWNLHELRIILMWFFNGPILTGDVVDKSGCDFVDGAVGDYPSIFCEDLVAEISSRFEVSLDSWLLRFVEMNVDNVGLTVSVDFSSGNNSVDLNSVGFSVVLLHHALQLILKGRGIDLALLWDQCDHEFILWPPGMLPSIFHMI